MVKKRTANILSRELREILRFLLNTIFAEDLVFLKNHFPEPWTDFSMESSWKEKNANCMWDIGKRITEVLDAKIKEKRYHFYTDGLDIDDALEVARILKIEIPLKTKKRKIIKMILKEIRRCKKYKEGGEKMPRVIGNDGVRFIVINDSDTIKKAIEKIREEKKFRKREKKIRREKTK